MSLKGSKTDVVYRAQDFAQVAGVTVRTLHHYDRLGLLKPKRNGAGYRLYTQRDLERLEHIVALKFLGLPLRRICALLAGTEMELRQALALQRHELKARRDLLDSAIAAVAEAEQALDNGEHPAPAVLRKIIEVIEMQKDTNWTDKYYNEAARTKIETRKQQWSPELQERISEEWTELFRDIEASLDADPASDQSRALTTRWCNLVGQFTQGDADVSEGLQHLWADKDNWPQQAKEQAGPFTNEKVWAFIRRAMAARKSSS
jgi:DNA-binding transcriptional MerR regulator